MGIQFELLCLIQCWLYHMILHIKQEDIISNQNETISFLFLDENYTNEDVDKRVDDFMKTFQNTFIIMIGNEIQWNLIYSLQYTHFLLFP